MAQLLSSKVVVVEEEPSVRTIASVPTAVAGFVGITERGPLGVATFVTSFEEYVRVFGGYTSASDLTLAVQGFFENGGSQAYIVRTVHYTNITVPGTKTSAPGAVTLNTATGSPSVGILLGTTLAPFAMSPADTLSMSVDGGGSLVATFDAAAAIDTGTNAGPFALADLQDLTVAVDGGAVQTIVFNTAEFVSIGAATALEVAAVINAEIVGANADVSAGAVRVTSDSKGTGSQTSFTGGTALVALGLSITPVFGTGDVADISAVTVAEIKAVVEADVANTLVTDVGGAVQINSTSAAGPANSIQAEAISTADDELGFDNALHSGDTGAAAPTLIFSGKTDGSYADTIKIQRTAPTSGSADEFNINVVDDGLIVEQFPNLSMVATATRYVETIINGASIYVSVVDQLNTATDPRPAVATSGFMVGGNDGLAALDDTDFVGSDAGDTGIRALDTIQDLTLLLVPGRATSAVHNAMITYCESTRDKAVFAVLDPPEDQSAAEMDTYVTSTAQLVNISEFGAIYWPRIEILNPSKAVFGTDANIVVPPSGHIAGAYARTDGSSPGGVYRAPAGIETGRLFGVLGFETLEALDEAKLDLLYPKLVNPITTLPGLPIYLDGTKTLKEGGNFPSIPERRGVIFIEQSLKRGLQFLKHQPNTEATRAIANRTVTLFLLNQMRNNAFASNDPASAFFVDTSKAVNPPSVIFARQMVIKIGLATAKPTDFVILKVSQDTRALEEELAS